MQKHNIKKKNAGNTVQCGVLGAVLMAIAQHHDRVLCHILLALEKIKIQISKYSFYCMCIAFVPL